MIALRLAKAGYGSPMEVLAMPSDLVMTALSYERFLGEYEEAYISLNKDK